MSDTPPTVELESPIGSPPLPSTEVGGTSSTSPNPSAIGASSGVPEKVVVHLRPTGNAPILKQTFVKVTSAYRFQVVIDFVKKQLNVSPNENVFLYVNSAFAPAPDEIISNLYKAFRDSKGDLVINYSTMPAWG